MKAIPKIIKFYEDESGKCPFGEWFENINDEEIKDRIDTRLARLAAGLLGDYKSVGKGVLELRMDIGPGYRIYFAMKGCHIVILLCGGDNNTVDSFLKS